MQPVAAESTRAQRSLVGEARDIVYLTHVAFPAFGVAWWYGHRLRASVALVMKEESKASVRIWVDA